MANIDELTAQLKAIKGETPSPAVTVQTEKVKKSKYPKAEMGGKDQGQDVKEVLNSPREWEYETGSSPGT